LLAPIENSEKSWSELNETAGSVVNKLRVLAQLKGRKRMHTRRRGRRLGQSGLFQALSDQCDWQQRETGYMHAGHAA
jgi:hypothetical protein